MNKYIKTGLISFLFLIALETNGAENIRSEGKVCTQEFSPVCAKIDTGIRCIKAPCPSYSKKTFSNACLAKLAGAEIIKKGSCEGVEKKVILKEFARKNPIKYYFF